ncbi:MAG TPA: hypothetical protein V6C65_15390, partial [Allocoleopsis sp.]
MTIAYTIGLILVILALLLALAWLGLELQFRRRPGNRLELTPGNWDLPVYDTNHYLLLGELELINQTKRLEVMVPELWAEVKLLSKGSLEGITTKVTVTPRHPDASARPDGYWFGYIVKRKPTALEIAIDIRGNNLAALQSAWVKVHYITYGPQGRIPQTRHVIVPLQFPAIEETHRWRPAISADVLPVRTHL